ncbi:MAG: hypothetical protein ACK5PF_00895, partial [bacterium]
MFQPRDLKPVLGQDGDMRLTTTTLLPSGALVDVLVRRDGIDHYSLSDDVSALSDLAALGNGVLTQAELRRGGDSAERFGLSYA